ncbi:DUF1127 domain-containing protein [Neorhizobium sp. NPDC001467]|uniref:DUF1127 domain-containing protein n=1 Tax=Neorhizobium sp. NPDC001467 TaxID=3390595 RepID=UPI003D07B77B
MRMNERMSEIAMTGASRSAMFPTRLVLRVAALWRALKNRMALNPLLDLDEQQLADLGLSRQDVEQALLHSGVLDDPYRHLSAARQRGRRAYFRSFHG